MEKKELASTIKELFFSYLDSFTRKEIALFRQSELTRKFQRHYEKLKLSRKKKISLPTIAVYLNEYRKNHHIVPVDVHKKKSDPKSARSIMYEFLDNNPTKRYVVGISKEYPDFSLKLIQQYLHYWYKENDVELPAGALKIFNPEKWTDEKLEVLKSKSDGSHARIMKELGKPAFVKQEGMTMREVKSIKIGLSEGEMSGVTSVMSRKLVSCKIELELLTRICVKYDFIDFDKTSEIIRMLETRLHKRVRTRSPGVVVGTSIFLGNEISKAKVKRIMEGYGGCVEISISDLMELLRIKKLKKIKKKLS